MQAPLSVILCTHNPRSDYLSRALDALRSQTVPLEHWEFLIIDNASQERLRDAWDISWHPRGRHVREDTIGLTAARLRGIKESSGELLVFLDDDNLPAPDFLERARSISMQHPHLGVFGAGILEAEFEVQPPPELVSRLSLLAVRSVSSPLWSNNANDFASIPWGAGLCVTRRIADVYLQLIERLNITAILGRRGHRLFSGEDDVFSWAAVRVGQGFGLFPELRVIHLISPGRLNRQYFLRLIHDHTFSNSVLGYLLGGTEQQRFTLERCVHLILHGIKNGQFSMRCQLAEVRGEEFAARFISENRLRPIKETPPPA